MARFLGNRLVRDFAREMYYSTLNEAMFDGRAKGKPSLMGAFVTDPLAKKGHQWIAPKEPALRPLVAQRPLSIAAPPHTQAQLEQIMKTQGFTPQEIAAMSQPNPILPDAALQKMMGQKAIDAEESNAIQRSNLRQKAGPRREEM